jgi:hypothetical protein
MVADTSFHDSRLGGYERASIFSANDESAFTRASHYLYEKEKSPGMKGQSRSNSVPRRYAREKKAHGPFTNLYPVSDFECTESPIYAKDFAKATDPAGFARKNRAF